MSEENPSGAPAGQPTEPGKAPEAPKPQDPKATAPKTPEAGDPPKDPKNEPLGEGGIKALKAEREAREALEKKLKSLEPLQKIAEALGQGDPDKGKSEIEQITERLSKHEEELASERQARWRAEVANDKGLTAEQAARLVGTTREELAADADALKALFPSTPGTPKPDPSQGGRSGAGIDLDSRIQEAQKNGDWRTVLSLQNQKLAAQATNQ